MIAVAPSSQLSCRPGMDFLLQSAAPAAYECVDGVEMCESGRTALLDLVASLL